MYAGICENYMYITVFKVQGIQVGNRIFSVHTLGGMCSMLFSHLRPVLRYVLVLVYMCSRPS